MWDLDLLALGAAADRVRRRLNPGTGSPSSSTATSITPISASPAAASAPFTAPPGPQDGYVLAWDELAAKLRELKDHGGSGVLLQGGLNPELPPDYYQKLVGFIRDFGLAVHGFSPPEIFYLAENRAWPAWKTLSAA